MRLWTIQPPEILDIINETGRFVCDKEKSYWYDCEEFQRAYEWMIAQMHMHRIFQPYDTTWPIWAWHTHNWKHKKPDFRCIGLGKPGKKYVCIEIEIPDDEVLLSDYDAWHVVLNNGYNNPGTIEEEWEAFDIYYDSMENQYAKELTRVASWNGIFNVEPFKNEFVSNGKYVQAVFWEIKKENIISVKEFTAR